MLKKSIPKKASKDNASKAKAVTREEVAKCGKRVARFLTFDEKRRGAPLKPESFSLSESAKPKK